MMGWAVRHVLQYGADAEVIAAAAVRERIRSQLAALVE
jgi:predicted DNA-binding transcriptional regulator YafY